MDKRYQGLSGELIAACMTKYQDFPDETWEQMVERWCSVTDESFKAMFLNKAVIPGGSMMYGLGKPGNRKISLSNCVVQTIREDSIEGIMEAATRSAKCYSYRMGVGTDLDILRPRDTLVNNAAITSSGAASFMQLYSTVCGTIGQQGRRGALMLTMSCWHPDIEEFVTMKLKNDKVTNANITVKITDKFMKAVIADAPWDLVWGGKVYKTIQATYLWNLIAETAFNSAEPGLLFIDRVWERPHANYEDSKPITTNPCLKWDQKLNTRQGLRKIKDLVGKTFEMWDGDNWVKTTAKKTGHKLVADITFSNGIEVGFTPDHLFFVDGEWSEVGKSIGGKLTTMRPVMDPIVNHDIDWEAVGFLQGDGTYRKDSDSWAFNINQSMDKDIVNHFYLVGSERKYKGHFPLAHDLLTKTTIIDRFIPDEIIESSPIESASFLRGLYSANGCIHKPKYRRISLKSINKQLIESVQYMLTTFGIRSYYTTNKAKKQVFSNGTYQMKESYDLNITSSDIVLFHRYIGFIQDYKNERLQETVDNLKVGRRLPLTIKSVKLREEPEDVYDFFMEETHHASVAGVKVHNCGEIPLPDDDVCLLTSLYLPHFVDNPYTEEAKFNFAKFKEHVRLAVRFGDKVKDLDTEMVPYEAIAQKSRDFRRIGVGTHGLSDCFWRMGMVYGKPDSQQLTNFIYQTLMQTSYEESIDLAEELGPFLKFDAEVEANNEWLKSRLPEELFNRMLRVGRRNLHLNTIAPTGTTSYISHGCSSGIEPPFDIMYTRFCLGKIYEGVEHGEFTYFKQLTGEKELRDNMLVSHQLTPEERVKIQGIATNWLDNSCSSTINFLNGTTVQQVKDVYMKAFEEGCEGITVFVDGSREGIVTLPGVKRERPTELPGKVYQYGGADSNYYITVTYSESRGAIEEIFVGQLTDSNPMVDSLDARLYELFKKYNLLNVLWQMEQDITPVNKVCYMMSMLFRHNVPTKEIISCTDGAIAGSLPFRIRMSILKTLPDSIAHAYDPDCLRGGCG